MYQHLRISKFPTRRIGLLIMVMALILAACSSASDPGSSTTSSDTGNETTTSSADNGSSTTEPTESPQQGDTLRMALPAITSTVDLQVYEGNPSEYVTLGWAAPLYKYVDREGITHDELGLTGIDSVEMYLAASEEEEDDGSLILTLIDAESPYGHPLTSEDVKWTFERGIALDFVAQFVTSVAKIDPANPITVIDDQTFRVNVTEPNPYVRAVLTFYDLSPLDSVEALSHATPDDPWATEWLADNSATYGPYLVSSFTPGEQVVLDSNPGWSGELPGFAKVVMQSVPDSATRLQLLLTGDVDYIMSVQPSQFQTILDSPDVEGVSRLTNSFVMLELNFLNPAFADQRVRHAIALAIDRDAIVQGPMRGYADVAANLLQPSLPQPTPPPPYEYNPERARELLAEAGYADGLSFTLTINLDRPGPFAEELAVLLKSQLADVGINVEINTVASTVEFQDTKAAKQYEAWIGANTPFLPDPWYQWQLDHHSTEAFQNHKGYVSEEFDRMVGELRNMPIGPERDAQISAIHELLMNDVPYVPILVQRFLGGVAGNIDPDSVHVYVPGAYPSDIRLK